MTFYGNHLVPRRGRVLPRSIRRPLPVIPCRAAPMCAAADIRRIPNGGAHWLRPTVVLPTPHPMSRTAPSNPVIARSGATWQSVLLLHRTSNLCVGAGFYPAYLPRISNHAPVGRHPCVPPPIDRRTPQKCHCAPVTDVTGAAIRLPFFTHPFRPFAQKSKPKLCKTEKPKKPLAKKGTQC